MRPFIAMPSLLYYLLRTGTYLGAIKGKPLASTGGSEGARMVANSDGKVRQGRFAARKIAQVEVVF
jgi:hypothetical protein